VLDRVLILFVLAVTSGFLLVDLGIPQAWPHRT